MNFTENQQKAITTSGKNIIISAGAGSGKTAVLTERVLRLVKEGIKPNNLLILTFTNAAAKEMKERIKSKLIKEKFEEEASLVDSSYITTFDSFSLSILKKYHYLLNIPNDITPAEETIILIEKEKILENIFNKLYQEEHPAFTNLIRDFSLKNDDDIRKLILKIYSKLELKTNIEEYLNSYEEKYFSNEFIDQLIKEYTDFLKEKVNEIYDVFKLLENEIDSDYTNKIIIDIEKLSKSNTYNEIRENSNITVPRLPNNQTEEAKTLKQELKDLIDGLISLTKKEEKELIDDIISTKENTLEIICIIKELHEELMKYKEKNELYTFTDIAKKSINLIKSFSEVKESLTNEFAEIMIDEYQDTSDIQEEFINLIAKNNIYMVGDIKQSIYRFRNANPDIFKEKYNSYSEGIEGLKIDLVENFRSREEVLDSINDMFERFMDQEIGGADYKVSHKLKFGLKQYNSFKNIDMYNTELLMYDDKNLIKNTTKIEEEAFQIAKDINLKLNTFKVYDSSLGKERNIEYKDITILLPTKKDFELYKKILEYNKIPSTIVKDLSLSKEDDIYIINNLLKLIIYIKEEQYDIDFRYVFTSIMRSMLYSVSDQEIFEMLNSKTFYDTDLYKKSYELSKVLDQKTPSTFLTEVLYTFDYENKLITIGNIKEYKQRLAKITELFVNLQEKNSLIECIEYLNKILEDDYKKDFTNSVRETNSVNIMTIHKSKGLEYPLCYFAGFSSKFNLSESKDLITYKDQYGIVLPKVDEYYNDTFIKEMIKAKEKKDEISERMRLLYVALTRAREKIVIVLPKIEKEEYGNDSFVETRIRNKYSSFYDMIKSIFGIFTGEIEASESIADPNYKNIIPLEKLNFTGKKLEVRELNIEPVEIKEEHYSKENNELPSEEDIKKMEFGTKVHKVLEETNFLNPKFTGVDKYIEEKVLNFISTDLIQNNLSNNFYKEYEFMYKEDTIKHGIIDLLIEADSYCIIVDYKLKNIEDAAYIKQLNGYKKYIEDKTSKPTKCYLYSIADEKYKEVV